MRQFPKYSVASRGSWQGRLSMDITTTPSREKLKNDKGKLNKSLSSTDSQTCAWLDTACIALTITPRPSQCFLVLLAPSFLQMMVLSNWTFSTRYFEGAARFWGILLLFVVSLPALTRARSPKTALFSLQITYHHSLLLNWVVSHRYLDILSLSHDTRCLKLPRCVPFSLAIGYSHIPTVYCSILLL